MKRFERFGPLVLAVLLLAAGAAPAEERPHRLKGTGQFVSATDFVGAGTATHLGPFAEAGSVEFSPTDDPVVLQVDGRAIHTAANGDQLYEVISGQLNVLTGAGTATATYVGGTGRFADARGSATLSLQLLGGGSYAFSGEGTIDY